MKNKIITTRPLEMRDAGQIKQIDSESEFEIFDFIEDMLEEQDEYRANGEDYSQDYAYGIFVNDELVGYCTIGGADEIECAGGEDELLGDVYIRETHRGKGYGRKLVEFALADHPKYNIFADILYDELEAFYANFGFVRKELGLLVLERK